MARGWKRLAEVIIARAGFAAQAANWARPSTLILAYHNIVPKGEIVAGDASLHLGQAAFADQLDVLLEHCEIVRLEESLLPSIDARAARVVITFDDAYVGTLTAGAEELARRGLPATVFVPPGLLGSDGFWWDRLAPDGGRPLGASIRDHALGVLAGQNDPVLEWARAERIALRDLPSHARPVTADALKEDRLPAGISLAAHTWSHPNLTAIGSDAAKLELRRGREWLETHSSRYVNWLAYPYGIHNDPVVAAAGELFEGSVLVTGGFAMRRGRTKSTPHRLPRLTVPAGLSLEGFRLRLAGVG